jgi:hypothetical protein
MWPASAIWMRARLAADAQHLLQQRLLAMDRLQRLGEDRDVERPVGEGGEAVLQVHLQHVDVVLQALEHVRVVDLDAVARGLALGPEALEQRAVAAAEVQHAGAGRDPAQEGVGLGHSGMFSK